MRIEVLVALSSALLVACVDEMSGPEMTTPLPPTMDPTPTSSLDDQIVSASAGYKLAFEQINVAPFPSSLGVGNINLYVSSAAHTFAKIHPDTTGSNVTLPFGTIIVREVLDASGAVEKLTVMAKGAPGYDPTLGDWWFGVLDPKGVPLVDSAGAPQLGRLTACHSCHVPRATDDFLFGVLRSDEKNHL